MHFQFIGGEHQGLVVPPIAILQRVISKMKADKARGILILPQWKSAFLANHLP